MRLKAIGLDLRKAGCIMAFGLLPFLCGCTGCTLLERYEVVGVARQAVAGAKDLPPGAIILPTSNWEAYVAKNAAQVYIPYRFSDASGKECTGTYLVRAKRLKLTWVLDYARPLPDYNTSIGHSTASP
ncbi:MAG: hypothetical protein ACUVWX_07540 [Kiritimatiellia bacterium]